MDILQNVESILQNICDAADAHRRAKQSPVCDAVDLCDIPYMTEDHKVHLLDLYFPSKAEKKLPVILYIHGGAWSFGSKETVKNYGMYLASKGFAVVNMDYTLAQDNDLVTQVHDVLACMRWITENATEFEMDISQIFLCGESSGAHLALLSYIVNETDTLRMVYGTEKVDIRIKAFGLSSPFTNLHIFTQVLNPVLLPLSRKLFGGIYWKSPFAYCASIQDVLKITTNMPAVFFTSSEEDVFKKQSIDFAHLLNRRHVDNRFLFCPHGKGHALGHAFNVYYPEYNESINANNEMIQYFRSLM